MSYHAPYPSVYSSWPWERLCELVTAAKTLLDNSPPMTENPDRLYLERVMEQVIYFLFEMGMTQSQILECIRTIDRILLAQRYHVNTYFPESRTEVPVGVPAGGYRAEQVGGGYAGYGYGGAQSGEAEIPQNDQNEPAGLSADSNVGVAEVVVPGRVVTAPSSPPHFQTVMFDHGSNFGAANGHQMSQGGPPHFQTVTFDHGSNLGTANGHQMRQGGGGMDASSRSSSSTSGTLSPKTAPPTFVDMPPTPVLRGHHTIAPRSRIPSIVPAGRASGFLAPAGAVADDVAERLFAVDGWHEGLGGGMVEVMSALNLANMSMPDDVEAKRGREMMPEQGRVSGETVNNNTGHHSGGLYMRGPPHFATTTDQELREQEDDSTSDSDDDEDESEDEDEEQEGGGETSISLLARTPDDDGHGLSSAYAPPCHRARPVEQSLYGGGNIMPPPPPQYLTSTLPTRNTSPPRSSLPLHLLLNPVANDSDTNRSPQHRRDVFTGAPQPPIMTLNRANNNNNNNNDEDGENASMFPGPMERVVLRRRMLDFGNAFVGGGGCGPLSEGEIEEIARRVVDCLAVL